MAETLSMAHRSGDSSGCSIPDGQVPACWCPGRGTEGGSCAFPNPVRARVDRLEGSAERIGQAEVLFLFEGRDLSFQSSVP